ncbi:MAG: nitrite/sulfite reductase, partial [Pseudomonadales bacterium]|nr:nitrite/sulfite reductase [Pseudomonadales bacterium]
KARIKILVKETGPEAFRDKVHAEWEKIKDGAMTLTDAEIERCRSFFTAPPYRELPETSPELEQALASDLLFASWYQQNVRPHQRSGYAIATLSLKETGIAPGDISAEQMNFVADLADLYSFGEMRISHQQNLVFTDVEKGQLYALWKQLSTQSLGTPNLGLLTDLICCPGGDFCALANAKSIPIAESIQRQFSDQALLQDIGELAINISGCMNACGHHHVGNIGILGVDKKGEEFYQVSLGGSAGNRTSLGAIMGPAFAQEEIPAVIEKIVAVYREHRDPGEAFIETYDRIGMTPFKERVYAKAD